MQYITCLKIIIHHTTLAPYFADTSKYCCCCCLNILKRKYLNIRLKHAIFNLNIKKIETRKKKNENKHIHNKTFQ